MSSKWLAPVLPYLAVWSGLFLFQSAWGALLGFHLALLAALILLRSEISLASSLQSRRFPWRFASVFLCGLSGAGLCLFWNQFGVAPDLPAQLSRWGLDASTWIPFIAYFSLVNPFLEEIFWRGALGSERKTPHPGDFIYAGYHALILWGRVAPLSIAAALVLLSAAGWFWRQAAREDGGLLAPILGHAAADFSILLCAALKSV